MDLNRTQIQKIKEKYPAGTRLKLDAPMDDIHPIPVGTLGTVTSVDDIGSIHMQWDNGSTLALLPDVDSFSPA